MAIVVTKVPDIELVGWTYELARSIIADGRRGTYQAEYCDFGPPQLSFNKPNVHPNMIRNLRPVFCILDRVIEAEFMEGACPTRT